MIFFFFFTVMPDAVFFLVVSTVWKAEELCLEVSTLVLRVGQTGCCPELKHHLPWASCLCYGLNILFLETLLRMQPCGLKRAFQNDTEEKYFQIS